VTERVLVTLKLVTGRHRTYRQTEWRTWYTITMHNATS